MNKEENTLVEMVLGLNDLDNATTALTELKYVNREKAKELALDVLEKEKGDVHFQASAFEVLYSIDQVASFEIIKTKLDSVDPVVFRSMLECVTEDLPLIEENAGLFGIVKMLNSRADQLNSEQCDRVGDTLAWFKKSFAGKLD
jgi:hypothetical protein